MGDERPKKPLLPPGFNQENKQLTTNVDLSTNHHSPLRRNKSSTLPMKPEVPERPKRNVVSMNLEDILKKPPLHISPILKKRVPAVIPEDRPPENDIHSNVDNHNKISKKVSSDQVTFLKKQLNGFKFNLKGKSNLCKLKSASSPSLFHISNEDFDETDGSFFNFKKKVKKQKSSALAKTDDDLTTSIENSFQGLRKRAETAPLSLETFQEEDEFSDLHRNEDSQLFDHVLVVTIKKDNNGKPIPHISFRFPPQFGDVAKDPDEEQRMESIPQFCFPDVSMTTINNFKESETFSFVLTDITGKRFFGFCKLIKVSNLEYPEVYCIVSPYGLFSMYSQILDEVEKQRKFSSTAVFSFLKAVLAHPLPQPNKSILVSFFTKHNPLMEKLTLTRPGDSAIHEHVDLSLLFSTLPINMIIHLLGCLLIESKLILCANSLSLLSSCCHALISLMYPFQWLYTYIPVLPSNLIDIVCSPSPYLLGLLSNSLPQLEDQPTEQLTIVNLETQTYIQKEHSKDALPKYITDEVAAALEEVLLVSINSLGQSEVKARNHVITEVFIHAYMELVGHFENHYEYDDIYGEYTIAKREFYKASSSKEQKKFLKVFSTTQAFHSFTMSRKKDGPSNGLFEKRFSEWKTSRSSNRFLKSKFAGILSVFKKKMR